MEFDAMPFTFNDLIKQLKERLKKAVNKATFSGAFIGIVVFFGGMGIWLPIYNNGIEKIASYLPETLLTYGVAMVTSLGADIILSDSERDRGQKARRIWGFIVGAVTLLFLGIGYAANYKPNEIPLSSIFALLLVWFLWLAVNANDKKYDEIESFGPLGGKEASSKNLGGAGL